jgi:hypothetical protein
MNNQTNDMTARPAEASELFQWEYLDQYIAVALRVEAANWLWWLSRNKAG